MKTKESIQNKRGKILLLLKALLKTWRNSQKQRRRYLRQRLNLTSVGSSNMRTKDKSMSVKRSQ